MAGSETYVVVVVVVVVVVGVVGTEQMPLMQLRPSLHLQLSLNPGCASSQAWPWNHGEKIGHMS